MTVRNLLKHYTQVYFEALEKLQMQDEIGASFAGPAYVPHPQAAGQLTIGWHLILTLKHNVLLGQPDIGVHIPIVGMAPDDEIIQNGARFLLENAREERFKQSQALNSAAPGDVLRQGNGDPLPPGLLPKGIGGQVAQRPVQRDGGSAGFKATAVGHKAELPKEDDAEVTDSESGAFKIVDRRKRSKK